MGDNATFSFKQLKTYETITTDKIINNIQNKFKKTRRYVKHCT